MKRSTVLTVLFCLCATAGFATAASDQVALPGAGYSIAPLEGAQALSMVLPASGGFAANVNVQIQPYPGTLDGYISLSQGQFRQAGLTVLNQRKEGSSEWIVEYTGEMAGRSLHWYSRAKMKNGKVYLATATATKEQWPPLSAKLRSCVDSLKVTN
jgi:hypothetical protein